MQLRYEPTQGRLVLQMHNTGTAACELVLKANAYATQLPERCMLAPQQPQLHHLDIQPSGHWYDFSVGLAADAESDGPAARPPRFLRRFAGRMETGAASISDPAWGTA